MKHGIDLATRVQMRVSIEDRGHDTPCWISDRAAQRNGYTKIGLGGKTYLTHRVSYEAHIGPIPDGMQLDHLCRQRACCNPDHLEPVTCRENLVRGVTIIAAQVSATHCLKGHPFDATNTRMTNLGKRVCRTCDRARASQYRERRQSRTAATAA